VLFSGAYETAQPREAVVGVGPDGQTPIIRSDADLDPAHITKGRARDDAPNGSRMIHVGLGVLVDESGPLPICGQWKRATSLSLEQQRRRETSSELLQEHYDLAVLKHTLTDDATNRQIAVRVLFVKSTADEKVVRQQRQKQIDRLTTELKKIQESVASPRLTAATIALVKKPRGLASRFAMRHILQRRQIPTSRETRRANAVSSPKNRRLLVGAHGFG
jgi:hypothetical protein